MAKRINNSGIRSNQKEDENGAGTGRVTKVRNGLDQAGSASDAGIPSQPILAGETSRKNKSKTIKVSIIQWAVEWFDWTSK